MCYIKILNPSVICFRYNDNYKVFSINSTIFEDLEHVTMSGTRINLGGVVRIIQVDTFEASQRKTFTLQDEAGNVFNSIM